MAYATFDSRALLAIEPRALSVSYALPASRTNQRVGTCEVVSVDGPLTSREEGVFDSYDALKIRCQQACMGDASTVVLKIDSPGGAVHGCFQTARDLRAMCAAAGKQLVAYIDGQGCSAAYALASAASSITAAETSVVGSIGVITERTDISEALARNGVRVTYTTSGSKKAYGSEAIPESEAERSDSQRSINNLATMFFTLVEQHRQIPAAQVALYQGGTFIGEEAMTARLVDSVGPFDALLIQNTNAVPQVGAPTQEAINVTFSEICSALAEMAKDESESAKLAAAMLAALETSADAPADEPAAEGDVPAETPEEDKKEEDPPVPAAKSSAGTAVALAKQVEALAAENAQLKGQLDTDAKASFFASNGVSDQLRAAIESEPLDRIKAIVAAARLKPETKEGLGTVKSLQGHKAQSKSAEDRALDRAFGLNKDEGPAVAVRGNVQSFRLGGKAQAK